MRELHGEAGADAPVSVAVAWKLLRDVEGYPDWIGRIVREAQVVARTPAGLAERVHTRLRAHIGPFDREFELMMNVSGESERSVTLERLPHEPGDAESVRMHWTAAPSSFGAARTRVSLAVDARLDVPRLLPLPSNAGDEIAKRFVQAAVERLSA